VRRNGGLRLNGQLLLGAERAAARVQRDLDVPGIKVQDLGDLRVVVDRALAVGVNLDAVPLRLDEARFGFEERDVHWLGLKRRLDDVRGARECRVNVSTRKRGDRLQHV
jgi:hypothetical protein